MAGRPSQLERNDIRVTRPWRKFYAKYELPGGELKQALANS